MYIVIRFVHTSILLSRYFNRRIKMWYSSIANGRKSFSRKGSLSDYKAKRSDDDDDLAMGKRSSCQENLHQYLLNSTLHGLRYVGERQISPFERFLFVSKGGKKTSLSIISYHFQSVFHVILHICGVTFHVLYF